MIKKPLIRWTLLAVALLAGALFWFRAPLSLEVARRVAISTMSARALAELPDGLHVGLCGAGSPFLDERRSGPCTLIIAGQRLWVFDAGTASARQIARMGFWLGDIEAVFLTHFHSDHIGGLGELMLQRWLQGGARQALPVYGPPGVEPVVQGFNEAYRLDRGYRVAHHGPSWLPAEGAGGQPRRFEVPPEGTHTVFEDADLKIEAFAVPHDPVHPALGYRIRYKDRSVVLSGDTSASAQLSRLSQSVDLLVHDALSPTLLGVLSQAAERGGRPALAKLMNDVLDYHATPEQAAQVAQQAQVRYLLLNHIAPTLPPLPGLEQVFLGQARTLFKGPIRIGVDGDFISLPAGSTAIVEGRRL